jgi:cellulose synthase/poly-beta-1,6-N-acetylglucosamine synthase-like glycosyltransferase
MYLFLDILLIIFLIVQAIIALYVLIPAVSLVIYGFLEAFKIRSPFERKRALTDKNFEFGIIITAHQEIQFLFPLVDSILKQTYPSFFVYIVADDCNTDELKFNDPRVKVLKPEPSLNAKIKSIHYGIEHFSRKHDSVIILDADNLIHPSFLATMNAYYQKGYRVVQCTFKPKNTDTDYERMDAIGDMFNFFLEREIRMRTGLSAAIWGSGVAVDLDLYQEVQYSNLLGGFDKKLQSHLVLNVDRIAFAPEAILFDEKITSGKSLETQRTRWISSYFKYFGESSKVFFTGLRKADFNLIYFGFNILRPPLFIVLGLAFFFTIADYFIDPAYTYTWLFILLSFVLSFISIVIIKGKDIRFVKTLLMLPFFVFRQVAALFKIRKARKSFLKTEHSRLVFIDDLLKK